MICSRGRSRTAAFLRLKGEGERAGAVVAGSAPVPARAKGVLVPHPWLPPHLKKNYQEFEKSVKNAAARRCHLTSADIHLAHDLQEVIVPAHSLSPVSTEEKRRKRRERKQLWREERQRAATSRKK